MIAGVATLMKHQTLMEDCTALDVPHKCVLLYLKDPCLTAVNKTLSQVKLQ